MLSSGSHKMLESQNTLYSSKRFLKLNFDFPKNSGNKYTKISPEKSQTQFLILQNYFQLKIHTEFLYN